jgi:hypothetical protein
VVSGGNKYSMGSIENDWAGGGSEKEKWWWL